MLHNKNQNLLLSLVYHDKFDMSIGKFKILEYFFKMFKVSKNNH